jgi:hypothetical protein
MEDDRSLTHGIEEDFDLRHELSHPAGQQVHCRG